jgi:hypothetical protein
MFLAFFLYFYNARGCARFLQWKGLMRNALRLPAMIQSGISHVCGAVGWGESPGKIIINNSACDVTVCERIP